MIAQRSMSVKIIHGFRNPSRQIRRNLPFSACPSLLRLSEQPSCTFSGKRKWATGNFSTTRTGWVLGGGVETGIGDVFGFASVTRVTMKLEYLYADFGNVNNAIGITLVPVAAIMPPAHPWRRESRASSPRIMCTSRSSGSSSTTSLTNRA